MQKCTKDAVKYILEKNKILNQSRLSKMLGITPQAVHNYLKGRSKASLTVADKFRELFDIEITDCSYYDRPLTKAELY